MAKNEKTKLIENPELFSNARNPQGKLGDELLDWMTVNHEDLARWGIGHLDIGKEDVILDIGCGGGINVERFLKMSDSKVYGIDYSELAVERSIRLNQGSIEKGRCEIIHSTVSELPFEDNCFDIITAFETVYFWPDIVNDLKEVRRVLSDGGIMFICNEAVPKENDERQQELVELLDMNIYSSDELTDFLNKAGFSSVESYMEKGRDSVTDELVTRLCVIASK